MQDLISMVILVAFFALAALFVKACDAIIGTDESVLGRETGEPIPNPERLAA
jgi:hypothetical protein